MKRIFVDFNTLTSAPEGVVKFRERFIPPDEHLRAGERVMLYDGEMEVEAILQHGVQDGEMWMAVPIPSTWRDVENETPGAEQLQRWSAEYDRRRSTRVG